MTTAYFPWRWKGLFVVISAVLLLAASLPAYELAMKDGRTIKFEKYRVAGDKLYYSAGEKGKEELVFLADVDLEKTRALNANATPPLDLPGLAKEKATEGGQPTLADLARQRRKEKAPEEKRAFTNDDLAAAGSRPKEGAAEEKKAGDEKQPARQKSRTEKLDELAQTFDRVRSLDRNQLGKAILQAENADVPFEGRTDWENEVYDAKQIWADQMQRLISHADSPGFEDEYLAARKAEDDFDRIADDGVSRAQEYKRRHP